MANLQPPAIRTPAGRARVVAPANQKGGSGKTTSTGNLGAFFAGELQLRVLLVDMVPDAALTKTFLATDPGELKASTATLIEGCLRRDYVPGTPVPTEEAIVNIRPNLDLLPGSLDLARLEVEIANKGAQWVLTDVLAPVKQQYDLIFVDTPPSLNSLHITVIRATDDVVIPLAPTFYDEWGIKDLISSVVRVRRDNPQLTITGVILNRVDERAILTQEVRQDLEASNLKVLGTIRTATNVARAPGFQQTIFEFDGSSKVADDYRRLGMQLMSEWTKRAATNTSEVPHATR